MITRRTFQSGIGAAIAASLLGGPVQAKPYGGPNVVLIRFGGGVRRQETIADPANTFAPYTRRVLAKRGVLIPNMMIDQINGGNTSHAEGTLNLLTGRYNAYTDDSEFLQDRLNPTEPTLFEYLRGAFDIPSHQALLINGEDRPQEEFFTFGPEGHYGIEFRSEMLSLHRFKLYKFARILEAGGRSEQEMKAAQAAYDDLMSFDARPFSPDQSPSIQEFWARWREYYGEDGFRNPRGDRLLTELALWAIRDLKPRLMMINYQDPDYVHWGNASHYTRAIQVIDDGIKQVMSALDTDPQYQDNTVVIVTPDCGRDANPLMSVPFQHHFNSRGAHEVWALIVGAGVVKDRIYDKQVDQTSVATTIAQIMGVKADRAEGDALSGLFT